MTRLFIEQPLALPGLLIMEEKTKESIKNIWDEEVKKVKVCIIISFLTVEYLNQTLQYFLGAGGILHSTLPREYTD